MMAMNPIIKAQLKNLKNESEWGDEQFGFFWSYVKYSIENGILGENINPFRAHLKGTEFGSDGNAISIQGALCVDFEEAVVALSQGKNHTSEFHLA